METKLCACGCGTTIPAFDKRGRARIFAKSHSKKVDKYVLPNKKKCNQCGRVLPISEFSLRNEKREAGEVQRPRSNCRSCENSNTKQWYANPEVKARKWCLRKQKRAKHIRYKIQDRIAAWRKKTPDSNLTVDYLVELWEKQKGLCYYTGLEMNWRAKRIEKLGMSLDRLDPSLGYIQDNVVFCCYLANTMKWNHSEEEFYNFMETILKHRNRI